MPISYEKQDDETELNIGMEIQDWCRGVQKELKALRTELDALLLVHRSVNDLPDWRS
jgi:hypothetical protein